MKIDLQMHSNFSDGELSPEELLRLCAEKEMEAVAISDHDTVDHIAVCQKAVIFGLKNIPAAELSVVYGKLKMHLLGFHIDRENKALRSRLIVLKQNREQRAGIMIAKLREQGFVVEDSDVNAEGAIGRPHIAQAILRRKENSQKLENLRISTVDQFFDSFLGEGKPAYVERDKLFLEEGIALIHNAGGLAVISHPGRTFEKNLSYFSQIFPQMKDLGCDGIETFYSTYTREQTYALRELAERFHLIETAGSDFHRLNGGRTIGGWNSYGLSYDFSIVIR